MKIKFTRSIGFKILFFYMMLALINVSFIIFILFENQVDLISKNSKLEVEQQFSNLIDIIKRSSDEILKGTLFVHGNKQEHIHQFIELIKPFAADFFIITDKSEVIYKSDAKMDPPATMVQDALRSITVKNFSGKEYYLRIDDKKKIMYCYIPFSDIQSGNTILLVVKDMSGINESMRNLYKQAVFVIIVMLFFHAVFALTLFKYIIRPLKQLNLGAKQISEGNLETRISLTGAQDEFESLAESFNIMAGSIHENMKKLTGEIESSRETIKRTDNLTVKDGLTGLLSRAYIIERIQEEIKKSVKSNNAIAVIMIDIDNFKTINTLYGSSSGNIILFETSKIITRNSSENDIVSRFADDSFIVLSTSSSIEYAASLSEKIRAEIENNSVVTPDGVFTVTASIGVSVRASESLRDTEAEHDLLVSAESALSQAKKTGKNRVEIIP